MDKDQALVRRYEASAPPPQTLADIQGVYEASFPPEERTPFAQIPAEIRAGRRSLWVTEPFRGFALTTDLMAPEGDVLLDYVAVAAAHRNRGVGPLLLRALLADVAAPILLEIEDPDTSSDPFAARRLDFYRRQGAAPLAHSHGYAMPNLVTGELLPMNLWELAPDRRTAPPSLPDAQRLVTLIWVNGYRLPPTDERLRVVLDSMS